MTVRETRRLRALPFLRRWLIESSGGLVNTHDSIPQDFIPAVGEMGHKAWIDEADGKLWKTTRHGFGVEIVDSVARLHEVLLMCHEGMGHRLLGSVYDYFRHRYWIPRAVKFIKCHILACAICQQFATDVSPPHAHAVPGFSPSAKEVFTHWSVDFACPFPPHAATGFRYIVVAVE